MHHVIVSVFKLVSSGVFVYVNVTNQRCFQRLPIGGSVDIRKRV